MARVAILGAGKIAEVHARGVLLAGAELAGVFDIREEASRKLAARFSTRTFQSADDVFHSPDINVVAIATSTETHADYIVAAAKAGKAIFCEKPIDLSVARAEECLDQIAGTNVFIQVGFNRRFDPSIKNLADAVHRGEIGNVEHLTIITRDATPAPMDYYKTSGGLFKDMTIHDFDISRFILREEPEVVFALGSVKSNEQFRSINDIDTATVLLTTPSGAQCQIMNSRRCVYGFDLRIEVFGSDGAVHAENLRPHSTALYDKRSTESRPPLSPSYLERFMKSYEGEWQSFFERMLSNGMPRASFDDGLKALKIAEAANESLISGQPVPIGR